MFGYLKLRAEIKALRAENELLHKQIKQHRRITKQWDNLFAYTGRPQEENLDED